jgi:hypothetical protein
MPKKPKRFVSAAVNGNPPDNIIDLGKFQRKEEMPKLGVIEEGKIDLIVSVWMNRDGNIQISCHREGAGTDLTQQCAKAIFDAVQIACATMVKATDDAAAKAGVQRKQIENQGNHPSQN